MFVFLAIKIMLCSFQKFEQLYCFLLLYFELIVVSWDGECNNAGPLSLRVGVHFKYTCSFCEVPPCGIWVCRHTHTHTPSSPGVQVVRWKDLSLSPRADVNKCWVWCLMLMISTGEKARKWVENDTVKSSK